MKSPSHFSCWIHSNGGAPVVFTCRASATLARQTGLITPVTKAHNVPPSCCAKVKEVKADAKKSRMDSGTFLVVVNHSYYQQNSYNLAPRSRCSKVLNILRDDASTVSHPRPFQSPTTRTAKDLFLGSKLILGLHIL